MFFLVEYIHTMVVLEGMLILVSAFWDARIRHHWLDEV